MKKVSLLALATTLAAAQGASADLGATLTGTCPKAFQGFFFGGNIGYGVGVVKERFVRIDSATADGVTFRTVDGQRTRLGVRGVDGGLNTGYTHRFGNWGVGLEFVANWANSSGKIRRFNVLSTATDSEVLSRAVNAVQDRVRLKNSLQLRGNLSYIICNLWAPKVILGWDNSRWSLSHKEFESSTVLGDTSTVRYSQSKSKRHNGFLWGAGIDFLATKHVIVGFEYTGVISSSESQKRAVFNPETGVTTLRKGSWRPQYNKFALTAKVIY